MPPRGWAQLEALVAADIYVLALHPQSPKSGRLFRAAGRLACASGCRDQQLGGGEALLAVDHIVGDDDAFDLLRLVDDRAEEVRRHRRQLVRIAGRTEQLLMLDEAVDGLFHVLLERAETVALRAFGHVAPDVRTLV